MPQHNTMCEVNGTAKSMALTLLLLCIRTGGAHQTGACEPRREAHLTRSNPDEIMYNHLRKDYSNVSMRQERVSRVSTCAS